jgi:hypothetical protein
MGGYFLKVAFLLGFYKEDLYMSFGFLALPTKARILCLDS